MTSGPTVKPIVYLVDDDVSLLRALARLLSVAGYAVQSFASATEFLARFQPNIRGCVVTDLRMPRVDGLDLQAALARNGNPLPVIFLTGQGDIPTSVQAMRGGAEDFLMKPVQKADLLAAMERALARDADAFAGRAQQRELQRRFNLLTPREQEVLAQVVAGKVNKQIAAELQAAERTIKAHRASIMDKLQARSPAELGRLAQEIGLEPS